MRAKMKKSDAVRILLHFYKVFTHIIPLKTKHVDVPGFFSISFRLAMRR